MNSSWLRFLSALLVATAMGFAPATVIAQEGNYDDGYYEDQEWWENSPNYNEDEAYDPTDWFDGNNYEYDYSGYYDDESYDDDWYYDYYDTYDYDEYGYDYGWF